jgi:anti-sigma-K factor RskA
MAMPETTAARVRGAVDVAVSMEQPGHTPAMDRPDGPVVASGELERL